MHAAPPLGGGSTFLLRLPDLVAWSPPTVAGQVYAAPLVGGARAVVLLNRHQQLDPNFAVQNLTVFWRSIGLSPNVTVRLGTGWRPPPAPLNSPESCRDDE